MRKPLPFLAATVLGCLLFSLFTFTSCKKIPKNEAYYSEISKYIYAYSSGAIGVNDVVTVRFTQNVVGKDQVGQPVAAGIFEISPSVSGTAVWKDESTLVFTAKMQWLFGKKFNASVNLAKLFPGAKLEFKTFDFEFSIRSLAFEVVVEGLAQETGDDAKKQQVLGFVRTSDAVSNDDAEKLLTAAQDGKPLKINWSHLDGGTRHAFRAEGIERGNVRSKVVLNWSGKPLDLEISGNQEVVVPSLGEFTVIGVRVENSGNPVVIINFSDPISATQNLQGLINLQGYTGASQFTVDGNFVRLFPPTNISGNYNLQVEAGIKNTAGAAMTGRSDWPVHFENMKPAVRLVGRGAIIPKNAEGRVVFPFEAVGLDAVDVEVFKIFNSNILQFLQVNDLEGSQELERVGKIILQKKISLNDLDPTAKSGTWMRYGLDLQDVVNADPSAIYQIRLAFRHGYTSQTCPTDGTFSEDDELARLGQTDEFGNLQSIFGGYSGIYFNENHIRYSEDENDAGAYSWTNRDNPCKREYYNQDHFVSRNAFTSDLGLTAKMGRDGSWFVAATDLNTTEPVSNVDLKFYNFQNQEIIKTSTDGNGSMTIEKLPDAAWVVVATKGDRRGYLKLQDGNSLSLSRFDVAGVETQRGLKGYLYGERGVWRPGDSMFLNFVLEDLTGNLPQNHPVSFELTDPKGTLQAKLVNAQPVGGVYAFHLATRADAPTGNWMAKVAAGGAKFSEIIKVETVKPNRLKIKLDFGRTELSAADASLSGRLSSTWLTGLIARDLKARVELQVRSVKTEFKNYPDYVFDDPARKFSSEPQVVFEGNLDGNGTASVPAIISTENPAPGKLIANFRTRVFEKSGDFSTDNFAMDYWPYATFLGISMAKDQWGNKQVDKENGSEIKFLAVDKSGKPLANRKLEVGLYRCDWRWWWDSDEYDNVGQFNSATHVNAKERTTLTTNAKGEATWKVKPADWGRYLVRATDATDGTEKSHVAGDFFWSGWPENNGGQDMASRNAAAMLPFSTDKQKYNVGDEVTLKVPASENGRILVTLETGDRVVDHFWKEAKAGDNLMKFRVDETMVPTVYAHVSLFQPHAQTKNDLPIRMYGVVPVAVENPVTRLEPQIAMPDVLKPGDNFSVAVSEKTGKSAAYTLAIVDEGLLDLTRFKTPNPWDAFFAREALGVKTWDVYDYVLGAFGAEMGRLLAVGGDGINQKSKAGAQVNRFKPVVKHLGPFLLKKGETAKHTLKIENYVGSVRVMAVFSAPNIKGKNAYGSAEKTCPVRQPLMILPTLPRVLGPGETLRLPVNVFAMENKVKSAAISVSESSGLVQLVSRSQNLAFDQPGDKMAYFDIKVGSKTGAAKFKITGNGGGESVSEEIEIVIRNPNPSVTLISEGTMAAGASQNWDFALNRFSEIKSATLEVSSIPPLNLSRHLEYLIQYPHGCIEQTTSGAFPQLYVDMIAPLTEKQKADVQKNVAAAISKIQSFQTSSGGFGYWPGDYEPSDWCSSYVGHFMLEAKNKGFAVPPQILERWEKYQIATSKVWNQRENANNRWQYYDSENSHAYRLYTLAMAGKPELGSMNRLRETKNRFQNTNSLLAAAYAAAGKPEVAREILASNNQSRNWNYDWYGYTYGSNDRDLALLLETQTMLGDAAAMATCRNLAEKIGQTAGWYSTQTLATGLRAISKFAQKNLGGKSAEIAVSVGGNGSKNYTMDKAIFMLPLENMAGFDRKISVQNKSGGQLFARLIYSGQPTESPAVAFAKNISVDVKYVDGKGNSLDVNKLQQGTDFTAEVTVTRTGDFWFDFNELALTQIFPSGWEIMNARMTGIAAGASDPLDYQDIRDDRVMTYFDLPRYAASGNLANKRTYRIQLNAAYGGRYFLPGVSCEAMYDNRISGGTMGKWVEVI